VSPRAASRVLVAVCAAASLVVTARALHDPPFWDALGCYVPLSRFIAVHGLDPTPYHALPMFRPPLLLIMFAALLRAGLGHTAMHLLVLAFAALAAVVTWPIARRLGDDDRAPALATAICLVMPIFVAQAGLEQSDLPAAALAGFAWWLALDDRRLAFAVVASLAMLTKESAHAILLPAAWLFGGVGPMPLLTRVRRALPALVPYVVLAGWLVVQRLLIGHLLFAGQAALIGISSLPSALYHTFIEGGRLLLTLLAFPVVRAAWRTREAPRSRAIVATAAVVVWLPLAFPAGLPRYMIVSLPLHCALAALGLVSLARSRQAIATLALVAALVVLWWAPTLDSRSEWHLESNLRYRSVLAIERAAVDELANAHARAVIAPFPFFVALPGDPSDGWTRQPIPAVVARGDAPHDELCRADWLVVTGEDASHAAEAALREMHATLTPHRQWQAFGQSVALYRVACQPRMDVDAR
jgi:hypothetical protein